MKTKKNVYWQSMATVWAGRGPKRKRGLRILPNGQGYFVHVTSRTSGQEFIFGEQEKRVFVQMLRNWADFSGLGILTHCVMDNHFHVMLWVPPRVDIDHAGLLTKLGKVWPEEKVAFWQATFEKESDAGKAEMEANLLGRMGDLPEFMRVLKQAFTCWYNRTHDRKGTLWDSRYRSVVVENSPLALMSVAAYIDLNPFRAGLVDDPMAYAWAGYGAAMAGDKRARQGLDCLIRLSRGHQPFAAKAVRVKQLNRENADWHQIGRQIQVEQQQRALPKNWKEVQESYRIWLVNKGESKAGVPVATRQSRERRGMDPVAVIEAYEKQGSVPMNMVLQMRIRSFSRGVALGSDAFLQDLMMKYRSCFGPDRKKAGCHLKGLGSVVMTLRQAG